MQSFSAIISPYEGSRVAGGNPQLGDVGGIRFFGLLMGQNQNSLIAFDTLFKTLELNGAPVSRIVELGTSHGGMSVFLQLFAISCNAEFRTYDLPGQVPQYADILSRLGTDVRQGDVLNDDHIQSEIRTFVNGPGVSVVLCDDGNKQTEFDLFAGGLKDGDLILVHDYATDTDIFEGHLRDRCWSFHEVCLKDISSTMKRFNLTPFLSNIFERAAWHCARRVDHP
jgi:hypothetical protein